MFIRKVARRILEDLDFQIFEAEDGKQALDSCAAQMPDAVLLDWNMPVMGRAGFPHGTKKAGRWCESKGYLLHH